MTGRVKVGARHHRDPCRHQRHGRLSRRHGHRWGGGAVPGATISKADVTVTEASGSRRTETYTVVLDTQPTHDVTITVTSDTAALKGAVSRIRLALEAT